MIMIENNDYTNLLLTAFSLRNPETQIAIDYAPGVAAETSYPVMVSIPEHDRRARILIDIDTPYSDILAFLTESLGAIEAGYNAVNTDVEISSQYYASLLTTEMNSHAD